MSLKWRYLLTPLALPALMTGLSVGLTSLTAQPPSPVAAGPTFQLASAETTPSATDARRGYLGVSCQKLTGSLREVLEIPRDLQGVLISDVVDGSPADRAGLRNRDVVVAMNGKDIDDEREFTSMIRGAGANSTVTLSVWRDGKSQDLKAILDPAPAGRRDYSWSWSSDDEKDGDRHSRHRFRQLEGLEKLKSLRDLGDLEVIAPMPPMPPESGEHFAMLFNSDRARLGVQLQELNPGIAEYFSAPGGKGALIWEVMKESPAEKAGLKAGDVIIEVEGKKVDDTSELHEALSDHDAGDAVALTVLRRGQTTTVTATLDEGPLRFGGTGHLRHTAPGWQQGFRRTPGPGGERETGPSLERIQQQIERLQSQLDQMRQKLDRLKD